MFLKVIARVAASVIIIVVLQNFAANNFLHIGGEFSAVYKGAGICSDIILLVIILIILWLFIKFMVCD